MDARPVPPSRTARSIHGKFMLSPGSISTLAFPVDDRAVCSSASLVRAQPCVDTPTRLRSVTST